MGSHEDPCRRVDDIDHEFKNKYPSFLGCYMASVFKADQLLKSIVGMLNNQQRPWSLIFTSDHAQNFKKTSKGYYALRDDTIKQQYSIPFIELGSNIKETHIVDITQSAFAFPLWFPRWIGVETNKTPIGFSIYNDPIPVFVVGFQKTKKLSELKEGLKAKDIVP